jgi:UDP-glucose 4-epimerase
LRDAEAESVITGRKEIITPRFNRLILITGGAGFIGPKIAERLLEKGELVRVLDNLSTGNVSNIAGLLNTGGVELVKGDVCNPQAMMGAIKGCSIVYHLAAQSSVPVSTNDPLGDMKTNVEGTINVLDAARSAGAKVVFASSSTVYGAASKVPTPEDSPLVPCSFYGLSKMAAEQYCRLYSETYGVPAVTLRLYNIFGPGTNKGMMMDLYRKLLRESKRLEVLGTGKQKKDYLYIDDTVDAFLLAPERARCRGEAYNIGLGESYEVFEIAKMVFSILGLKVVEVVARGGESWQGDVQFNQPDVSMAERELGWKAKVGMRDGLERTLAWFEAKLGPVGGKKRL